jgi:transposase
VSAGRPLHPRVEETRPMIVLGADMHKSSHTIAAVAATTGEMLADKTAAVGARGFDQMLQWARTLGRERVWALEDCRQVSGSFERFLIARGERVVRVATRLMANSRRSSRERGKSDRIDARAVARAALAEGIETLPSAELAGPCATGAGAVRRRAGATEVLNLSSARRDRNAKPFPLWGD